MTDRDLDAVWNSVLTEEARTRRAWGSDPLIEQYCFGITKGDDDEVGLTFEPEARLRTTAQIEGVLWLDAGSAALRRLESSHARLLVRGLEPGGDVIEVLGLDHQLRPLDGAAVPQAVGAAQEGTPAGERVGASSGPPPEEGRAFTTSVRAREQPRQPHPQLELRRHRVVTPRRTPAPRPGGKS